MEKKSRFIAQIAPVKTEEEALAFVEEIRRQHWNARHHCYAYIIGERGQTAGAVMTENRPRRTGNP